MRGEVATRLLSKLAPSMIKMEVAPVSAIAWFVAIVSAFEYCSMVVPNNAQAVTAINERGVCCFKNCDQFDITNMAVPSLQDVHAEFIGVGSKDNEVAENKLLHLCANNRISALNLQLF